MDNETNMKSDKVRMEDGKLYYAPYELKFSAIFNGQIINEGDFWLPDEKGGQWNCYPVKISSMGIHYTRKIKSDSGYLTHSNGKTYYADWENEGVHSREVSLFMENTKLKHG